MWARLGFTRRLLVTSTAKKCEPIAGGPAASFINVIRLEEWGAPIPFPCKLVLRYRGGVSECPIQPNDLMFPEKRRVAIDYLAFMPCTKNCVIVGKSRDYGSAPPDDPVV
jgi:hypothetical protein